MRNLYLSQTIEAESESSRVQAARGLACLLLVTYHVIGPGSESGIRVADDSLYRYFTDLFLPIRMPLFTFLSGFVYVYKPMIRARWRTFAGRKLLRLGLPLLVASTFTYLILLAIAHFTGAESGIYANPWSSFWRIYVYPLRHLWFLHALLSVIAIVMVLEALRALATFERFIIVFGLSLYAFARSPVHAELFGLHHVPFLLPFFLLGVGANRFRSVLLSPPVITAFAALFVISMAFHAHAATFGHVAVSDRNALLPAAVGMAAVLCVVRWIPRSRFLQWIGSFSFSIYLYHLALILFVDLVAEQVGVTSKPLLLALGLAAGLTLPILAERLARKNSLAHLILLGQYRRPGAPRASALSEVARVSQAPPQQG